MNKRNVIIEFYRFFFAIAIAFHHFRMFDDTLPFGGGYLAVDFFLVVSGFFLAKSLENTKKSMGGFVLGRYLRLWKEYIVIFLLSGLIEMLWLGISFTGDRFRYLFEALMLGVFSNDSAKCVIPAGWYCGYLFLGSIVFIGIYSLLKRRMFLVSGIISVAMYVILFMKKSSLCIYPEYACYLDLWTLLRVMAGLLLGGFLYRLLFEKNIENKKILGVILIVPAFCYLAYSLLWDMGFNHTDYVKLLVFVLMFVVTILIGNTIIVSSNVEKMICFLGDMSYTIFLSHFLIVRSFCIKGAVLRMMDWKIASLAYIAVTLTVALVLRILGQCVDRIKK